ncbi:hypothetical protein [Clostridium faecium]|uniref:Uncharacterized protein n=1 Tax=Clostridium faecium TaxID=2762223 RepID=A0ABR8YTZ5_9CLOT|nr:hypothetical protein [Clostridium faecium]MBD8047710.1 hypothetical protein [Clostridium faecium]MDU1348054.1 hypothetical protein [Clostridium argentinense]
MKSKAEQRSKTKLVFEDIFTSFKVSLKIYLIPIILGVIASIIYCLVKDLPISIYTLLRGPVHIGIWISCLGLLIGAVAFIKPQHMEPLNYQKQWRTYYKFFNLIGAIVSICFMMMIYSLIIDTLLWYMTMS